VLVSASRWLGVPPWELELKPSRWVALVHAAARAEADAEKNKANLAKIRARTGGL
jgi:hypothetical protein